MNRFAAKRMKTFFLWLRLLAFVFGCALLLSCQWLGLTKDQAKNPAGIQAKTVTADAYRLNSGDKLEITVWHEENLKSEVVVLPDGTISFPLVGHALGMAGGLTQFAKRNSIQILRRDAEGHAKGIPFEYSDVEGGENIESNILLQSGDTIIVP